MIERYVKEKKRKMVTICAPGKYFQSESDNNFTNFVIGSHE